MLRFYAIIFLILIAIFPTHFTYAEVASGELRYTLGRKVDAIFSIDKIITNTQNSHAIKKLYQDREALAKEGKRIYEIISNKNRLAKIFDVSYKYRLTLQKYNLSCEIAALRIILQSLDRKIVTEEQIIRGIPQFRGSMTGNIWGDPDKEFVGSYRGSQRLRTGYGVYEFPLAKYTQDRGYRTSISNSLTGISLTPKERLNNILESISTSSSVILWGDWCTSVEKEDGLITKTNQYVMSVIPAPAKNFCSRFLEDRTYTWQTPEGKLIQGLSGEHAFVLLGYAGEKYAPTHIIVWDTDTGKHYYETSEWMRKWALMDYRTLIVEDKK